VALQRPVAGWVTVEACRGVLRSVELTLGRVEWCTVGDHSSSVAREATDIQCTQIAEGDVLRGLPLPIHLILPRLYTCPNADGGTWGVHFEIAITAFLADDGETSRSASCRLPLRLVRVPN